VHRCRSGERAQIARIRSQDHVAVGCEKYDRGIDDVGLFGVTEQHTDSPPELLVERHDLRCSKEASDGRLTPTSAPPYLSHDSTMRDRELSRYVFALQKRHHLSGAALDS
jgi:hypothetical protein